jgi:nucleoside-diphosphate-sugar epimerase
VKALVVGGTGPTGPHIVEGLVARGYEVALLHRGLHETDALPPLEHIHADPFETESLVDAVRDRHFEVVLGMYGRVKAVGEAFADRCGQLICVSGMPVYRGLISPETGRPSGMALLAREDGPLVDELSEPPRFAAAVRSGETFVLDRGRSGAYRFAGVRYPQVYGPRNTIPWEWPIVRRALDNRHRMIVPDDGLWIITRCAARNAAEVVLKLVDSPDVANGKYYNAADDDQFTVRQLAEMVIDHVGAEMELVGVPSALSPSGFREFVPPGGKPHILVDSSRAKSELGYREVVPARAALVETIDWMLSNPVELHSYRGYEPWFDYPMEDLILDRWERLSEEMRAAIATTSATDSPASN